MIEHFIEALKEVGIDADPDRLTSYDCDECAPFWQFREYIRKHYPSEMYNIEWGASKVVIIPDDDDYVLKIPFHGEMHWEDQPYDEETGEYDEDYDAFCEWQNDYCEMEEGISYEAEEEGLDFAFALEKCVLVNGSLVVYQQEKATPFNDTNSFKYSAEERKTVSDKYGYDLGRLNIVWALDFVKAYGEERFRKLLDFCNDQSINDLHDSNVGYICGAPVLIDYSGFWE